MRRWLAILAILSFTLFILLLTLEPLLHHHDEGEEDDHECQVCKWLNELGSTLTAVYLISVAMVVILFSMTLARPVMIRISRSSSIRAPPTGSAI
jgi:hypothetical protein